jgi:hypothetical protein
VRVAGLLSGRGKLSMGDHVNMLAMVVMQVRLSVGEGEWGKVQPHKLQLHSYNVRKIPLLKSSQTSFFLEIRIVNVTDSSSSIIPQKTASSFLAGLTKTLLEIFKLLDSFLLPLGHL